MFVWMRYSEGLMVAHGMLIVAYVLGAAVLPPRWTSYATSSQRMLSLVVTCSLGFAVVGFTSFFLALAGVLNIAATAVALLIVLAAAALIQGESLLREAYWRARLAAFASCWDVPTLILYYVMLALAFPAMNLVNLGSDPVAYHLAYAVDWARSGHLVVDPFLRVPFYANNFVLLYSVMLLLHAQVFVMFLVWLTGLLTALGVFSAVRWVLSEENIGNGWAVAPASFLTAAVILSPAYARWLISAYIDVPIGAFALLSVLALLLSMRSTDYRWLPASSIIAGFLIGMKESFLPLVIVFAIAIWWAARAAGTRRTITALVLLLVAASPWYIRNWVDSGDPIWPVINLAVYGHDGLTDRQQEQSIAADLPGARSATAIVTVPARAFLSADTDEFREYGVSALILGLYIPAGVLLVMLAWRRRTIRKDTLVAVFVLYMLAGYWAVSSVLLRYATLFYPLLAVCVALALAQLLQGKRWRGPVITAIAILCALPSAGSLPFMQQIWLSQYYYLPQSYLGDDQYQSLYVDGYPQMQLVSALESRMRKPGRVYVLGWRLNYYLRLRGLETAGDWVGPAGYFTLYDAIDAGESAEFLNDLGVNAVLVDPRLVFGGLEVPFRRQLIAGGFCLRSEQSSSQTSYAIFTLCREE